VVGAAADPLVDRLAGAARTIRVGPGRDPASDMGPVVTAEAKERVLGYVERGVAAGAELVCGGEAGPGDGYFIQPTLFDRVTPDMDIYTDEIFGPVLVVLRVDTLDEAIELVNTNPYGNGVALFTSGGEMARRFQRRVCVGMIGLNVPIPVPMAFYSFGGWKASLFGDTHVHGTEGVAFYTRAKVVTSRWPGGDAEAAHLHFPTAR
jgi:malonate-semialdehyde dehydrogenase (acetylating)/methylmalonate-semialdehyde dehydrogenase